MVWKKKVEKKSHMSSCANLGMCVNSCGSQFPTDIVAAPAFRAAPAPAMAPAMAPITGCAPAPGPGLQQGAVAPMAVEKVENLW